MFFPFRKAQAVSRSCSGSLFVELQKCLEFSTSVALIQNQFVSDGSLLVKATVFFICTDKLYIFKYSIKCFLKSIRFSVLEINYYCYQTFSWNFSDIFVEAAVSQSNGFVVPPKDIVILYNHIVNTVQESSYLVLRHKYKDML